MGIFVELSPVSRENAKTMAMQNHVSVSKLVNDTIEMMFRGDTGFIILNPAPSPEDMEKIQEAIKATVKIKPDDSLIVKPPSLIMPGR